MVTRSSHSISMCPPHSPTRITKKSILKLPGAFHWPKTSRIRFWAFSYSIGEPCGRSTQLIMYFIGILQCGEILGTIDHHHITSFGRHPDLSQIGEALSERLHVRP